VLHRTIARLHHFLGGFSTGTCAVEESAKLTYQTGGNG
jgi:hypothetical protein